MVEEQIKKICTRMMYGRQWNYKIINEIKTSTEEDDWEG
jgi:hypothetical protein